MGRPEKSEYLAFYQPYVERVQEDELIPALESAYLSLIEFAKTIPEGKYEHKYQEGKWTIKEVFIHMADTERVFQYRALRFSRNDSTELAGFDEKLFIKNSNSKNISFDEAVEDLINVRKSTLSFFKMCSDEQLMRSGTANGANVTVRALGFIIAGHQSHHFNVINTRYLYDNRDG